MKNCNHSFVGLSDFVRCDKCGLTYTAEEFIKEINKKPTEATQKVKTQKEKKKNE